MCTDVDVPTSASEERHIKCLGQGSKNVGHFAPDCHLDWRGWFIDSWD